jgi:hypothetical protein
MAIEKNQITRKRTGDENERRERKKDHGNERTKKRGRERKVDEND